MIATPSHARLVSARMAGGIDVREDETLITRSRDRGAARIPISRPASPHDEGMSGLRFEIFAVSTEGPGISPDAIHTSIKLSSARRRAPVYRSRP